MWQGHRDSLIISALSFGIIGLLTLFWWLLYGVFKRKSIIELLKTLNFFDLLTQQHAI